MRVRHLADRQQAADIDRLLESSSVEIARLQDEARQQREFNRKWAEALSAKSGGGLTFQIGCMWPEGGAK
jgi:hypothetical protein